MSELGIWFAVALGPLLLDEATALAVFCKACAAWLMALVVDCSELADAGAFSTALVASAISFALPSATALASCCRAEASCGLPLAALAACEICCASWARWSADILPTWEASFWSALLKPLLSPVASALPAAFTLALGLFCRVEAALALAFALTPAWGSRN